MKEPARVTCLPNIDLPLGFPHGALTNGEVLDMVMRDGACHASAMSKRRCIIAGQIGSGLVLYCFHVVCLPVMGSVSGHCVQWSSGLQGNAAAPLLL